VIRLLRRTSTSCGWGFRSTIVCGHGVAAVARHWSEQGKLLPEDILGWHDSSHIVTLYDLKNSSLARLRIRKQIFLIAWAWLPIRQF
jgi:hypothetical protein